MKSIPELVDRLLNRTPAHLVSMPVLLEESDEGPRIDLTQTLRDHGWPSNAITAHAAGLFAAAVKRRYVREHGHEPLWDHGLVYRGVADWRLIEDTYRTEIGAIAEQLAFEGREQ